MCLFACSGEIPLCENSVNNNQLYYGVHSNAVLSIVKASFDKSIHLNQHPNCIQWEIVVVISVHTINKIFSCWKSTFNVFMIYCNNFQLKHQVTFLAHTNCISGHKTLWNRLLKHCVRTMNEHSIVTWCINSNLRCFFLLHCALYGSMQCNEFIELNADCEFQVLIFHSFDMQKNAIGQTSNWIFGKP